MFYYFENINYYVYLVCMYYLVLGFFFKLIKQKNNDF